MSSVLINWNSAKIEAKMVVKINYLMQINKQLKKLKQLTIRTFTIVQFLNECRVRLGNVKKINFMAQEISPPLTPNLTSVSKLPN